MFMTAYWATVGFLLVVLFFLWLSEPEPKNRAARNYRVAIRGSYLLLVAAIIVGFWLPVFIPGLY